jgi:DNA-binding CsgD family transcriptional regulator/PAS domain-containing protein
LRAYQTASNEAPTALDQAAFDQFIDLAYEAAADAGLWTCALGRFAELTGASGGALQQQNLKTGEGFIFGANVDPEAVERYFSYYSTRNPLHTGHRPWMPTWILRDEDILSRDELVRTEYYADFMRPAQIHWTLRLRLGGFGQDTIGINLFRTVRSERFEDREIRVARAAHGHLIRAFKLGRTLAEAGAFDQDLAGWAESSPHGLFLLDAAGVVLRLNAVARRMLDEPGGLGLAGSRLTAAGAEPAKTLDCLITRAASLDPGLRRSGSMPLATPGRRRPLWLTVTPGPRREPGVFSPRPAVIVCANDLDARIRPAERAMRDLFGLTPAEARLTLALADGLSLRDISEAFALSPHTVHEQLKHVFAKTDTHRQAELVRLVLRTAGVRPD